MFNIAINKEYKNKLRTAWMDVKKAFDSIDHEYLLHCIDCLNIAPWIYKFMEESTKRWKITLFAKNNLILKKRVSRGVLQDDSLSPLLFVVCMDPLSKCLNAKFPMVQIPIDIEECYSTNHLLFIDDLKLLAEDESTLGKMLEETMEFCEMVNLEINPKKSATNAASLKTEVMKLDDKSSYRYIGITEDCNSDPLQGVKDMVTKEIIRRANELSKTKSSGKNMIKAINEYFLLPCLGGIRLFLRKYKNTDL
ncbi:Retrovirus-related Pol polyprotein from type-1 retrotransposable element R2 [Nosema granulosis]|uniref:Retrovirus-related Pol polyprotein from type-1 retrotransposable element R2 n=1 Tax=Nosema granulosis TaxID=83296 RepID=A0A9P6GWY5_9MICR|nr:Retrovirus-related Pol polyprotein from type-1 retrotransposable element R2 [Nosema granulosis]